MNFLLIGHRGYLGTGLHAYLGERHKVIGWDKEEDMFKLDATVLSREKIDAVLNLSVAADRNSPGFTVDSLTDVVNVGGARHLARILKGTDVGWFQISTREVFGRPYGSKDVTRTPKGNRPKFLVNEDHALCPLNSYGKAKLMTEFLSESHPFSNVLRLSTCYTDYDHPNNGNWVLQMIRRAAQGELVTLAGGGRQFRDPLHVNDLGRLIELLTQKKIYGHKINAGGGRKNLISLEEFIRIAVPTVKVKKAPGGDFGFAFDIRKAKKLVGWEPNILFREKLPIIAANLINNLKGPTKSYGPLL